MGRPPALTAGGPENGAGVQLPEASGAEPG